MSEERQIKVKVNNLTKKFGDLLVLDDISFEVGKGEFLCIVGPTGCGKTTFLNSLTKLYDLTAGEILIDGSPVDSKVDSQCRTAERISCRRVQYDRKTI